MNSKHGDPTTGFAIGRRSILKGSVVGGGVALAESLFAGAFPGAVSAAAGSSGGSQETKPSTAGTAAPLGEIVPIKLEYVFQIRIDFKERVSFQGPHGTRAYVPAISGVIEGPRLQGRVVPHSARTTPGTAGSTRTTCFKPRTAL
jgi:hypothetical protein